MKLTLKEENGVSVLEVWGDIQFSNWHEFVNGTTNLLEGGNNQVVISWEHVEYIDSSGMGALVSLHKLFSASPGSRLALYAPQNEHIFMLEQAHFHTFLKIFSDLDKALEHFAVQSSEVV